MVNGRDTSPLENALINPTVIGGVFRRKRRCRRPRVAAACLVNSKGKIVSSTCRRPRRKQGRKRGKRKSRC